MPSYAESTRLALVAVLSHSTTGFNAQLAEVVASYGIVPFELDFTDQSRNVIYGYLDDEEIDVSTICEFPGANIHMLEAVDEKAIIGRTFSGFVAMAVNFYIRLRKIDDANLFSNQPDFSNNYEKWPNAVGEAMFACLKDGRSLFRDNNVTHTATKETREAIRNYGDGHVQKITFTAGFKVHV